MVDTLLQPGDIVADRYHVEGRLGVGGHAYVYTGRQVGIGRKVAIKILKGSQELGDQKVETLKKRFEQEARLIAQLKDPHTITLYDYGTTKGGHLYMASEFVDGVSLKEMQKVEGALGHERVLSILNKDVSTMALVSQFLTAGLLLGFVALGVVSFIQARRARDAGAA